MTEHDQEPVVIHVASSLAELEVVRSILEGAGINCLSEHGLRWDEFAKAAEAMNLVPLEITVSAKDAERARKLLAEARAEGAELSES